MGRSCFLWVRRFWLLRLVCVLHFLEYLRIQLQRLFMLEFAWAVLLFDVCCFVLKTESNRQLAHFAPECSARDFGWWDFAWRLQTQVDQQLRADIYIYIFIEINYTFHLVHSFAKHKTFCLLSANPEGMKSNRWLSFSCAATSNHCAEKSHCGPCFRNRFWTKGFWNPPPAEALGYRHGVQTVESGLQKLPKNRIQRSHGSKNCCV